MIRGRTVPRGPSRGRAMPLLLCHTSAMTSRTHIAVGVAAALVAVGPTTPGDVVAALVGGSVGSLICDVDVKRSARRREVMRTSLVALVAVALVLVYDYRYQAGVCARIDENLGLNLVMGVLACTVLGACGTMTRHRTFTHSIVALACWSAALAQVCEPLVLPFGVAMTSHLALDVLNKKGVRLLWPLRYDVCLGLCRSDGVADAVLGALGAAVAVWQLVSFALMML